MAIISGDINQEKRFVTYALGITRIDLESGERLGVKHMKLRYPFKRTSVDPGSGHGSPIQGAANGSESIIQG